MFAGMLMIRSEMGVTDVSAGWVEPRCTPQDESCGYRYEARFSGLIRS
jgi:hypothetical protein